MRLITVKILIFYFDKKIINIPIEGEKKKVNELSHINKNPLM